MRSTMIDCFRFIQTQIKENSKFNKKPTKIRHIT